MEINPKNKVDKEITQITEQLQSITAEQLTGSVEGFMLLVTYKGNNEKTYTLEICSVTESLKQLGNFVLRAAETLKESEGDHFPKIMELIQEELGLQ